MSKLIKKISPTELNIPEGSRAFTRWMIETADRGTFVLKVRNKSKIHSIKHLRSSTELEAVFYIQGCGHLGWVVQIYFPKMMIPILYAEIQVIIKAE
jgi:hypothetical protein